MLSSGPEPGAPSRPRRRWTTPLAGVLVAAGRRVPGRAHGRRHRDRPAAGRRAARSTCGSGRRRTRPAPDRRRRPRATSWTGCPGSGRPGCGCSSAAASPACSTRAPAGWPRCRSATASATSAELDHAGGTTTVLLHNPSRLRARAVALGRDGTAAPLGQVLDLRADAGRHRARRGLRRRRRHRPVHADRVRRDRRGALEALRAAPARPGPGHPVRAAGPGLPGRRGRGGAAGGRRAPARSTG